MTETKVALITGASQGLGRAMAERLVADGFTVVAWDLKVPADPGKLHFQSVDVSDEKSVRAAAAEMVARFSLPQVVVNNAGITRDQMLHKMSVEDFEATLRVNLRGSFLPTQVLGSLWRDVASKAQKAGETAPFRRLVFISSVAGLYGNVGQANYAASKAGVVGLMHSVAKEWGRFGISAVAVAPGFMRTEMVTTIPAEIQKQFIERTPLRRMGEPSELAGLISYLARPESAFLTGDVISFSGGLLL